MASQEKKMTVQRRMGLGWGMMMANVVVMAGVGLVWVYLNLPPLIATVLIVVLAAGAISLGIFLVRRLSRTLTSRLKEAVTSLSSAVAELMAIASQVAAGTAETAASTNETTVTVEGVKQTAMLAHEKASLAAAGAGNAAQELHAAQELVEKTAAGIEQMQPLLARRWSDAVLSV